MIKRLGRIFSLPYLRNKDVATLYFTYFAIHAWFIQSFWYLYFSQVATPTQIALVHTVGFTIGIALDIPTGYLADRFGRKRLLLIGLGLFTAGLTLFAFITQLWQLLVFEIIIQLGLACISGALEAVVHGVAKTVSTKKLSADEIFNKIYAKCRMITNASLIISALVGGYIYNISDTLAWLAMALLCLVSFVMVIKLKTSEVKSTHEDGVLGHSKDVFRFFFERKVRYLLPVIFILAGIAYSSDWGILYAATSDFAGYSPELLGILLAITYSVALLLNAKLDAIIKVIGSKNGFYYYSGISAILLGTCAILSVYSPGFLGYAFFPFIALSSLLLSYSTAVISKDASEKFRATALSTLGFGSKVLYLVAAPLMGIAFGAKKPIYLYLGFVVLLLGSAIGIGALNRPNNKHSK